MYISGLNYLIVKTSYMGKKLSTMTWKEVGAEMSIAGNPEKITRLGEQVMNLIAQSHDSSNRAELENIELMLKRISAEIKLYQRMYDRSH
jgi:hypothetical protein